MGTDSDWKKWGSDNPYFGVCSDEKFRNIVLTKQARDEFFASGEAHIEHVLQELESIFQKEGGKQLESALDFGCGVGRLVIPLARRASHVLGVDISPSMIDEAQRNCVAAGVENASFVLSDDTLSRVSGDYGLVHSHIVLQHIAWPRGRQLLCALADHVASDGFLAIQVLTGYQGSRFARAMARLRYAFPPIQRLRNFLTGRPASDPPMQLHVYDLNIIISDLESRGIAVKCVNSSWENFTTTTIYGRRA